ncbi:MAG: GDSL-type esterase/lipase family protein, partial [Candidatus Thiodiazotropha sp.]
TMRPDCSVTDTSPDTDVGEYDSDDDDEDDYDSQDSFDYESDRHSSTSSTETIQTLNDSVTHVKTVASDPSIDNGKHSKCCDTCKIKPRSKKQHDMIRCSLCMVWYHEQCVGIQKDEPVGLWLCTSCRAVPHTVQGDITSIRNDVEQLQQSTELILTAVQELTTKLDNCVGNINDKLTALSRQISCNDRTMSESIETLNVSTNNLKTNFDQKTCQLLNKTSAVLEKVKSRADSVKTAISPSQRILDSEIIRSASSTSSQSTNTNEVTRKQVQPTKEGTNTRDVPINANLKPSGLKNQNSKPKQPKKRISQNVDTRDENELIDLTDTLKPTKFINRSTLLVGSSILKGVKVNELKSNVAVRSFPGATIETLRRRLLEFNIDRCQTIIIHVGGNDADQGCDLDTFSDDYFSLLDSLSSGSRRLIVSGLLPRETVDLEPFNQRLKSLCEDYDIEFVDHYHGFLLGTGEMLDSCFQRDMTHVTSAGTKKIAE